MVQNWKVAEAVSKLLNCCATEIKKVVEYTNCYYVQFNRGSGRFVSKNAVTNAREDSEIKCWLRDFNFLRSIGKLAVGTTVKGAVKEFDGWSIDAMEAAIYTWRVGLHAASDDDKVWIGYYTESDKLVKVCDYKPEVIF